MENKVDALINQTAAGYAYLELLDELINTDCYRGEIKQRVNQLMNVLEKFLLIDLAKMLGNGKQSDEALVNIIHSWKTIFKNIGNLKPENVPPAAEILKLMIDNPDKMMEVINTNFDTEENKTEYENSSSTIQSTVSA